MFAIHEHQNCNGCCNIKVVHVFFALLDWYYVWLTESPLNKYANLDFYVVIHSLHVDILYLLKSTLYMPGLNDENKYTILTTIHLGRADNTFTKC